MYEFPSTPAAQWRSRMDVSLRELEIVEEESRSYQAQRYARAAEAWQVFADQHGRDISADRSSMQQRSFRAELATVLSIPEVTAENLLGRARILVGSIPTTYRAFEAGRISERHATILADAVAPLGPDDTAESGAPSPTRRSSLQPSSHARSSTSAR